MKIKSVFSEEVNINAAVSDIKSQLQGFDTRLLVFFASSQYEPSELSQAIDKAFADAQTFGCSTAGEIISGRMLKNSLVAMAFNPDAVSDFEIEVVESLKEGLDLNPALLSFEKHFNASLAELDFNRYVGIILVDGLSGCEEKIMDRIGDKTNIIFIGGSAGDDLKFAQTHVFANGKAYTDAAVLAVLKPKPDLTVLTLKGSRP